MQTPTLLHVVPPYNQRLPAILWLTCEPCHSGFHACNDTVVPPRYIVPPSSIDRVVRMAGIEVGLVRILSLFSGAVGGRRKFYIGYVQWTLSTPTEKGT